MASPASIGGHPIHPMIIPFPIALWVFSLVADVIYLWRGNHVWRDYIAFYTLLGGIIGAVSYTEAITEHLKTMFPVVASK